MFIFILFIYFGHTMWLQDFSSATQDWTCAPCSGGIQP